MKPNPLRIAWSQGRAAINGWLAIPNSFSAELMAHAGWDTLTIDQQHGLVDDAALVLLLQAITTVPSVAPVVRVPWLQPAPIMKALDAGALAIICPMISSREEAQRFVDYCTYPPKGTRSFGPVRAGLLGGADYFERADAEVVRFAMIETAAALDSLDQILSVEGLDAIYIGPSDLSLALGCRPTFDDVDPPVAQAIDHVLARAKAHGVKAGIHNGDPAVAAARVAKGFDFVTVGSDARLLAAGAAAAVKAMRKA